MSIKCKFEHPDPPKKGEIGPRVTRISRILRCRFNEIVGEEGLFAGQQHIVLLLKHNPGLTVSQVAESLNITPATASVSIKRMEKAGFIEKRADEKDARVTKLYLTVKGQTVPERIKEKLDLQEEYITKGMSREEIYLLSDLLDKAISNLSQQEGKQC